MMAERLHHEFSQKVQGNLCIIEIAKVTRIDGKNSDSILLGSYDGYLYAYMLEPRLEKGGGERLELVHIKKWSVNG